MLEVKKFWSPSCGPCRMLAPIMEKVLLDYPSISLVDKLASFRAFLTGDMERFTRSSANCSKFDRDNVVTKCFSTCYCLSTACSNYCAVYINYT